MSPPLLGVEGEGQCNISQNGGLKECNYLGLSDSSANSSAISNVPEDNKTNLNLKATELRLGLPGSQSPERDSEYLLNAGKLDVKPLFPLLPLKDGICMSSQKMVVSGNKRGFSDTMNSFTDVKCPIFSDKNWILGGNASDAETQSSGQGKFSSNTGMNMMLSNRPTANQPSISKDAPKACEQAHAPNGSTPGKMNDSNSRGSAPAAKAQVVGWPPIRSFRKNTLATTSKNNEEVDGKPGPGALFVKVSMAGAPYLRKVDLRTYSTYNELSTSLEKMFSCFTIGQCEPQGAPGKEILSETKLRDLLHGSEYVLTYEDKDGDWMLVGDVPWEMFIESCKRLKIMKGSDAIGLAPRAMEKSKNKN